MLVLKKIVKEYRLGDTVVPALRGVSINFRESEFVSILGPSGCGKTTLLNIIGGLDQYTSGDLVIDGRSTRLYKDRDWDTYRNHRIGFVFQNYNLIPHRTILDNVETALTLSGVKKSERRRRAALALRRVGLGEQMRKKPSQMSGGQMQRVAIARALVGDPDILLADEPTGALDTETSVQIMEILRENFRDKLVIMVTHNPELAAKYSTRIIKCLDGQVVSDSRPLSDAEVQKPPLAVFEAEIERTIALPDTAARAERRTALRGAEEIAFEETDKCRRAQEAYERAESAGESAGRRVERAAKQAERLGKAADKRASDLSLAGKTPRERKRLQKAEKCRDEAAAAREQLGKAQRFWAHKQAEAKAAAEKLLRAVSRREAAREAVRAYRAFLKKKPLPGGRPGGDGAKGALADVKRRKREYIAANRTKAEKKPSMSFFTALSLSFTNLLTKKGRTFLTSFAGSIGIIGIALILALSNGIQTYIDRVQEDTLSSYPLSLQKEEVDLSGLFASVSKTKEGQVDHDKDAVYSSGAMYDLINAMMNAETKTNNLTAFKAYFEARESQVEPYLNGVSYSYDVSIEAWAQKGDGSYVRSDAGALVSSMYGDMMGGSSAQYMSSSLDVWSEILSDKSGEGISDLVKTQYDVLYGTWPENFNEVVIIVDSNNEITDLTLYTLGLKTAEEMKEITAKAMKGEVIEVETERYTYEEICGLKLKLVLPSDYYVYNPAKNLYEDIRDNESALNLVVGGGVDLHVCGIVRRNPDATAGALDGAIGYTSALTKYVIEGVQESAVVKAQKAPENANRNVVTGLPFILSGADAPDAAAKAAAFREYLGRLTEEEKAQLYRKILTTPSQEEAEAAVEGYLAAYDTREKREALVLSMYLGQTGMEESMLSAYLSGMSDGELESVIRRAMESMFASNFAAEAEKKLQAIVSTPTDREMAALKAAIGGRLSVRAAKAAFVAAEYASAGVPLEVASNYLAGLSDEAFEEAYEKALDKKALETYENTVLPAQGADAENAKLAAALDAFASPLGDERLSALYDDYMPSAVSDVSLEENLTAFGLCDLASPSAIRLYPVDFASKEQLAAFIEAYNQSAAEEDVIEYTDYVALLMSSITVIIDVISYVLIAFVAISLVVSSIMIGIITYISVLERTKEIGILRAMGASKRDVSRVFNAETLIIGFGSGAIGIGATLLLCIPLNAIVRHLSGIRNIGAALPPMAGVILVAISMALTLLAGLVPASMAARKDPVVALRSE